MATVMSQMPDVWRRALAEHVPDGARHCRACCSPTGVQASWPCQTFKVADEARALAEGYLPVPSAPAPREPVSGSHRSYDPLSATDPWSDTPSWVDTPPSWSDSWSAGRTERHRDRSWDPEPSWASEPRTPSTYGREIADLPVEPRTADRWDRDERRGGWLESRDADGWELDRREQERRGRPGHARPEPWSYGASFGADPWSR